MHRIHEVYRLRTHWLKHYHTGEPTAPSVKFATIYSNITYKYLLVPAWISSFKYKDKIYQFAVNGQTGKVGGKSPVSGWRVMLAILIGVGICVGLYYLLK